MMNATYGLGMVHEMRGAEKEGATESAHFHAARKWVRRSEGFRESATEAKLGLSVVRWGLAGGGGLRCIAGRRNLRLPRNIHDAYGPRKLRTRSRSGNGG